MIKVHHFSLVSNVMSPTVAKYSSLKDSRTDVSSSAGGPTIDVEREMAAANAYSSSGYKGYYPSTSPYSTHSGRQSSLMSPSVKVNDSRDKVKG